MSVPGTRAAETEALLARAEKLRRPRSSLGNQEYAPPGTADFVNEVAVLIPQLAAELVRVTAERDEARADEKAARAILAIPTVSARMLNENVRLTKELRVAEVAVGLLTRELEAREKWLATEVAEQAEARDRA